MFGLILLKNLMAPNAVDQATETLTSEGPPVKINEPSVRECPCLLPKGVDAVLRQFVRSFIMDHIPEDPAEFIEYAACYFNQRKAPQMNQDEREAPPPQKQPAKARARSPRSPRKVSHPAIAKMTPKPHQRPPFLARYKPAGDTSDSASTPAKVYAKPLPMPCPHERSRRKSPSPQSPSPQPPSPQSPSPQSPAKRAASGTKSKTVTPQDKNYACCYCAQGRGTCQCTSNDDFEVNTSSDDIARKPPNVETSEWWRTKASQQVMEEKRKKTLAEKKSIPGAAPAAVPAAAAVTPPRARAPSAGGVAKNKACTMAPSGTPATAADDLKGPFISAAPTDSTMLPPHEDMSLWWLTDASMANLRAQCERRKALKAARKSLAAGIPVKAEPCPIVERDVVAEKLVG